MIFGHEAWQSGPREAGWTAIYSWMTGRAGLYTECFGLARLPL